MERKKPARKREPRPEKESRWGFRGMTVRDWLPIVGALLIPVAVAAGTWWITWQLGKIADQRAQQAQEIETQRAEAEREIAEQRAQHTALQAYLDQMSVLLPEKDLRTAEVGSEVRRLARARTLTVLTQVPAAPGEYETDKEQVVEFLMEAELVQRMNGEDPIISLEESDLREVDLDREDLHGANLKNALLAGADLEGANLEDAKMRGANLEGADLEGATMPNGQKYEDWLKDKEGSGEDAQNGGPS